MPQDGELEFAVPVDTRGLEAGIYDVWIDLRMDDRNWMALHGAVPASIDTTLSAGSNGTISRRDVS